MFYEKYLKLQLTLERGKYAFLDAERIVIYMAKEERENKRRKIDNWMIFITHLSLSNER